MCVHFVSALECKLRWKALRGGLTRFLKKSEKCLTTRPFYLYDEMKFVVPFLKQKFQMDSFDFDDPEALNDSINPEVNGVFTEYPILEGKPQSRYYKIAGPRHTLSTNEATNHSFVQTVEKYKCLYDQTIPQYNSKDEQDKAWREISEQFNSTGKKEKNRFITKF